MARWVNCVMWGVRPLAVAGIVAGLGLAGCGKKAAEPEAPPTPPTAAPAPVTPATGAATALPPPPQDERHLPFAKATRPADNPPEGADRPPDQTVSGKSVYKLYQEVLRTWDAIRFTAPSGKRIDYTATVETDKGVIVIALRPDVAPNHVRNFVALARAGYYDGLRFDRIVHEDSEDQPGAGLDEIEGGCPLGTGDPRQGSIGYWLKDEFSDKVTHEPGTVGACRGTEADSAACRFYITLGKAPILDGNYTVFGRVTQGLDVVRKIFEVPVIDEDNSGHDRPETPVLIRKVTIQQKDEG
jgi:peptidyl-prolyl cis-trans isomerase B (cyclophilin B)